MKEKNKSLGNEIKKKLPFNVFSKKGLVALAMAGVMIASPLMLAGCSGGKNGIDGTRWESGLSYTEFTDAKVGDFFIDTDDYILYKKTADGWIIVMENYGKPGTNGEQGQRGQDGQTTTVSINSDGYWVINGTTTTTKATGEDGNTPYINADGYWYIDGASTGVKAQGEQGLQGNAGKSAFELYQEAHPEFTGTLQEWLESLKGQNGTDGTNGATWLTGTAVSGTGTEISVTVENAKVGDLYFNTSTCDIYTCTAENTWKWLSNIKGEKGTDGTTPTIAINSDGYWVINGYVTDVSARGETGAKVLVSSPISKADVSGKKITIVGDSITAGVGATDTAHRYANVLAENLGATVENKGISGTTLCVNTKRNSRLSDIQNYSGQTDYFIIALGTNDYYIVDDQNVDVQLGTLGSEDTSTVYGAFNVACKSLKEKFEGTNTKIYLMTPIIQKVKSTKTYASTYQNRLGYTLRDFCEAIIETGAMYDIPTLDMNILSGIDATNASSTMKDEAHPTDLGHKYMADTLTSFILSNYSYVESTNVRTVTLNYSSSSSTTTKVESGATFTLPNPTYVDRTFLKWIDEDGNSYAGGAQVEISKNKTFTESVTYNEDTYTVTVVNMNGGTCNYSNFPIKQEQTLADAIPNDISYTNSFGLVATLYSDENCTTKLDTSTTLTEDSKIYVGWETDVKYFAFDTAGTTLTGFSSDGKSNLSSFKQLILPKESSSGVAVTTLGDSTNAMFNLSALYSQLSEIVVPEGYQTIKGLTFSCSSVSVANNLKVTLPSTLTSLDNNAFIGSPVSEYVVADSNTAFVAEDGVLYDAGKTIMLRYPNGKTATSVTIAQNMSIRSATFYNNSVLTEIVFKGNNRFKDTLSTNKKIVSLIFDYTLSSGSDMNIICSNLSSSFKSFTVLENIYVKDEYSKTLLEEGLGSYDDTSTFGSSGNRDKALAMIKVMSEA